MTSLTRRVPARLRLAAGLAVVWLTFGSAFIGTKVGVSALPPLLFAGTRFALAGALILVFAAWRSGWRLRVSWRELGEAAVIGGTMVLLGQGSVTWSSTILTPGVVAVLVSTVPLWSAVLARLFLGGRLTPLAVAGLVTGFGGACLLAAPTGSGVHPVPLLVLSGAAIAWAAGTLVAGRSLLGGRPLVLAGLQMLVGGLLQLVAGAARGEPGQLHPGALTPALVAVFVYLLVVVSLLGFTTFSWVITTTAPALASSQAFVVPVVAMLLGWLLLREPIGLRSSVAAGVSLAGVALLVAGQGRSSPRRAPAPSDSEVVRAA